MGLLSQQIGREPHRARPFDWETGNAARLLAVTDLPPGKRPANRGSGWLSASVMRDLKADCRA